MCEDYPCSCRNGRIRSSSWTKSGGATSLPSFCVTRKVIRVKVGESGVHFLDFCEDQAECPFTVVVFSHALKDIADVRRLAGRTIEIVGYIKLYEVRPEIILNRINQIRDSAAMIPPLPKNYDVENRGRYSARRLYPSKKPT